MNAWFWKYLYAESDSPFVSRSSSDLYFVLDKVKISNDLALEWISGTSNVSLILPPEKLQSIKLVWKRSFGVRSSLVERIVVNTTDSREFTFTPQSFRPPGSWLSGAKHVYTWVHLVDYDLFASLDYFFNREAWPAEFRESQEIEQIRFR